MLTESVMPALLGVTTDQSVGQRHVEQALEALAEGGRLVAILPGGLEGESARTGGGAHMLSPTWAKWWEKIMAGYNVRANIGLPGKLYGKYGTTFATRLVVIDKDGPTPGGNLQERLSSVQSQSVSS